MVQQLIIDHDKLFIVFITLLLTDAEGNMAALGAHKEWWHLLA